MQILIKVVVTSIAGGITYLLTNITKQPEVWQITMSVFVAGVVLVVQFLIDAAEQSRRLTEAIKVDGPNQSKSLIMSVEHISEAATHLAAAENLLGGRSLTRLVEAAGRMDPKEEFQLRFAERQVSDLALLLDGLRSGRAEHEGEDPDWLLGLTETATLSIDATSMTSFDKSRRFIDSVEFWSEELGVRYLDRQRQAIERNVRIRRLFVLMDDEPDQEQIESLLQPHRRINVETRVLRPKDIDFLHQKDLDDYILFDSKISYEFHRANALNKDAIPMVASVALVVDHRTVQKRRERFEGMWNAAAGDEAEPAEVAGEDVPAPARS